MERQPAAEPDPILRFTLDGVSYALTQNVFPLNRMRGYVEQYLPDAEIIEPEEEISWGKPWQDDGA